MKVICIDDSIGKHNQHIPNFKAGEVCDAEQDDIYDDCYEINGGDVAWYKKRFIPLSSIDETELLEQREEALLLSSINNFL